MKETKPTSLEAHLASHAPTTKKNPNRAIGFADPSPEPSSRAVASMSEWAKQRQSRSERRAAQKAARRAAHIKAHQDWEEEEEEVEERRVADPPAFVATGKGEIVAAPRSPPRASGGSTPPAVEEKLEAEEKKPGKPRGILKKSAYGTAAVQTPVQATPKRDDESSDSDGSDGSTYRKRKSLSVESTSASAASSVSSAMYESQNDGLSLATKSVATAGGASVATSVVSTATSSADTQDEMSLATKSATTAASVASAAASTDSPANGSASTAPTKNTSFRTEAAEANKIATILEGEGYLPNDDAEGDVPSKDADEGEGSNVDFGTSAFWEDSIDKKEGEMIQKKKASRKGGVDGGDRSGEGVDRSDRSGGGVDKSDRSGKSNRSGVDRSDRSGKSHRSGVDRSDRSGKSNGSNKQRQEELDDQPPPQKKKSSKAFRRSSSDWNEMIEKKKKSKRKIKGKKEQEDDGGKEVPTAVVIDNANDAVQNWKESSGLGGEADGHRDSSGKRGAFEDELTPEEVAANREKQKRRLMMLAMCLVVLLVLILGLAFGLQKGGDDGPPAIESNDPGARAAVTQSPSVAPSAKPTAKPTVPGMWIFDTPVVEITPPPAATLGVPPGPSAPPVPVTPTNSPMIAMVETVHSIDLILDNVPEGYAMPAPIKNSILGFVTDMIKRDLDEEVELVDVSYADMDEGGGRRLLRSTLSLHRTRRRLATLTLPLLVTVLGPASISDLHLRYVMEVLEDTSNLEEYLGMLNKKAFADVAITVESGSSPGPPAPAPITAKPTTAEPSEPPSPPPTSAPTTDPPTLSPTSKPTQFIPRRCDDILMTCPDGSKVAQNPFQNCNFFPCPNQQEEEKMSPTTMPVKPPSIGLEFVPLGVVTTEPSPQPTFPSPTASPFSKPTALPLAGPSASPSSKPTASPTAEPSTESPTPPPSVSPSVPPTTIAPSDSPTLRPTDSSALLCSPDLPPNVQCDGTAMTLLEKCSSSDTVAKDEYGHALDMATRSNGAVYAIVGARHHDTAGSAYLISYDEATRQWEHVVEIIPGGASQNGGFDGEEVDRSYDQFGYAVAITSDWVAISAPFDTASTGRVSLYWLDSISNGGQMEPDADLVPQDKQYSSRFGSSIAMDGDTLVVGAVKDRSNIGSAYIFQYSNGEWLEVAKVAPEDASVDSQGNFGHSVAISQGIIVVGAPYDGTSGRRRNGSVYVYSDSGSFLQKIIPFELLGGDQFGYSLAVQSSRNPSSNVQETRIAIGARMRDDKGIDSGSVYLYLQRDGEGEFTLEQKLTPFAWATGAEMGTSVDMDGTQIIVGAKRKEGSGGAYSFRYDGLTWSDMESVTPLSVGGGPGDDFGSAVALESGIALIGAHSNDEVGEDGGAFYSYAVCD